MDRTERRWMARWTIGVFALVCLVPVGGASYGGGMGLPVGGTEIGGETVAPQDLLAPAQSGLSRGDGTSETSNVEPDRLTEDQRVLFTAVLWMLMVLMLLVVMDGRRISRETRVGEVGLCTG